MKFEKSWTGNWENAFRGLRHPYESYAKSDSEFLNYGTMFKLGPNDLELAQRMIKAGTPNDKFLRQIFVSVDITAPLFLWKELDTYKVGTTANSTSTMHKLASTPITLDCFETDDLADGDLTIGNYNCLKFMYNQIIDDCELLRQKHLEFANKAKNATSEEDKIIFQKQAKKYWKELIRWLPESWLQTRTWTADYAVLRNIIHWRTGHKLTEWASFIDWCHTLPYADELLFYAQKNN